MLILVNNRTKKVRLNPAFYLMKHLSHFVLQGAFRLNTSGGKDHLTFINPDGTIVLLIVNTEEANKTMIIDFGGKNFQLMIKGKSFHTLTWKP